MESSYSSFTFWREPVMPIDESMLQSVLSTKKQEKPSTIMETSSSSLSEKDDSFSDDLDSSFNSFNFWREPIADIDLSLEA